MQRIVRRLIVLSVVLISVVGCRPVTSETSQVIIPTRIPSPTPVFQGLDNAERIARQFLDAWTTSDYETMYSLIAFASQEAVPFETFQTAYQSAADEMRLRSLAYIPNALDYDQNNSRVSIFNYNVTFTSGILGAFSDNERNMNLILEPEVGDWRVAWSLGDIFEEMARNGRLRLVPTIPRRGSIYDRNGTILADQNGALVVVSIIPQEVPQMDTCLASLIQATGDDISLIQRRLSVAQPDWDVEVGLLEAPAYEQWQTTLETDCSANFNGRPSRRYLFNGSIAPHILGYVGYLDEADIPAAELAGFDQDSILGRSGIELSWDKTLRGEPGGRLLIVTPDGEELRVVAENTSQPSQSLYLTLDAGLQQATQNAIRDAFELYKDGWGSTSRGGSAIVLDLNTGAILALVTWPTYDVNAFTPFSSIGREEAARIQAALQSDVRLPLLNRPTQGRYPTGSVMKMFTSSAVADSGVYALDQRYTCSGIWQQENGLVRTDWLPGGHGTQTLAQAITNSCNPYFYEVGYQLNRVDPFLLPNYLRRFGLGSLTGLTDIPEEAGLIGDPDLILQLTGYPWAYGEAVSMAIGQGFVEATPLQVVRGLAAIANGGTLYRPQLVDSVRLIDDISYQMTPDAMGSINIRQEVLDVVREGMCNVTTAANGTAEFVFTNSPLQTIGVCGKTGTAEDQGPNPGISHAWFAGYAPRENPQIAVVAMIENSGQGSEIGAPIVREIMEYYFFESPSAP